MKIETAAHADERASAVESDPSPILRDGAHEPAPASRPSAAPDALRARVSRLAAQLREYRSWMKIASEQTGKGALAQIREIVELRRLGGQCGITDYYWHKLYDDAYLRGRGRADFLGWRLLEEFSRALNPRFAVLPAWDKAVFTQIAHAGGLPVAPVRAFFHRTAQVSDVLGQHLGTLDEAAEFLRDASNYPLFGKPAFSHGGHGAAYLASFDAPRNAIVLLDGRRVALPEFLARLTDSVDVRYHKPQCGYLFQSPLQLAPEIAALTQWTAICGVRVVCLNGPDGAQPIRAAWKIAVAPNHTDNFGMGDHGNLVADVDLDTGVIDRVIGGFWPTTKLYDRHPTTGRPFKGFRLPGWERILDACRRGGEVFPLMRIHHWDFALTDEGPRILELNDIGGTQIPQMHGQGLLTERTRAFLKRYAEPTAHPWVSAL